jgi:hypothetical protein
MPLEPYTLQSCCKCGAREGGTPSEGVRGEGGERVRMDTSLPAWVLACCVRCVRAASFEDFVHATPYGMFLCAVLLFLQVLNLARFISVAKTWNRARTPQPPKPPTSSNTQTPHLETMCFNVCVLFMFLQVLNLARYISVALGTLVKPFFNTPTPQPSIHHTPPPNSFCFAVTPPPPPSPSRC